MFANKGPYSQNYGFFSSHVWMWELDYEKSWALKNWCFWIVLEKTLENPLDSKEIKSVNPKGYQPWIFIGRLMLKLKLQYFGYKELNHWKRPWCWERSKAGGEGDDRGWDGWMVSSTQWTRVWVNSRRKWRTGKPGLLLSMGSQSWTQLSTWTTITKTFWRRCYYTYFTHSELRCYPRPLWKISKPGIPTQIYLSYFGLYVFHSVFSL